MVVVILSTSTAVIGHQQQYKDKDAIQHRLAVPATTITRGTTHAGAHLFLIHLHFHNLQSSIFNLQSTSVLIQQQSRESVGSQHILIVDAHGNMTAADLLLTQRDGQHLVIGKGHLLQHHHLTVAVT